MANARKANVQVVDTSAAFPEIRCIKSILYIGATSATASIQSNASSGGLTIWQRGGDVQTFDSEIEITDGDGVYVTVASGAKVYLYLG